MARPPLAAYVPDPEVEGIQLIKLAIRAFLTLDLTAYGHKPIVPLLPAGVNGILDEGLVNANTQFPVIMFSTLGDGQSELIGANSILRLIIYVIDQGRGQAVIEKILSRVRTRLNDTQLTRQFFAFPPTAGLRVEHIEAKGSTASASSPAWKAESRGIFTFLTVYGLEAAYVDNDSTFLSN